MKLTDLKRAATDLAKTQNIHLGLPVEVIKPTKIKFCKLDLTNLSPPNRMQNGNFLKVKKKSKSGELKLALINGDNATIRKIFRSNFDASKKSFLLDFAIKCK